jgi:transcriptional regulator with XRE-family HTH domain
MPINIGPTLRRRREWARLTQQELVDHTRMDRSASYISALETGRSSPTLSELEQLARYFRLTVIELLQEAMDDSSRRGEAPSPEPPADDRLPRALAALDDGDQELALDFMELLSKRRKRAGRDGSRQDAEDANTES